jgi:hypothetical protein
MTSAYFITAVCLGIILLLKIFCRRAEQKLNRGLSYHLASNLIRVLWPVAVVAALFSAASLYLVHFANDSSTRIETLLEVEHRLHEVREFVEHYQPTPWLSLIIIVCVSIPTLLRIPPDLLKQNLVLKLLVPAAEWSLTRFKHYRRIATPLSAAVIMASSLTFFAAVDAGTPLAVLDARIGEAGRHVDHIRSSTQQSVARQVVTDILHQAERQWPPHFPPAPSAPPGAPENSFSASKGIPIDAYLESVERRYHVAFAEKAETQRLAARYHLPAHVPIWQPPVPLAVPRALASVGNLTQQAVADLARDVARDAQSSRGGAGGLLGTEPGRLVQEAGVEVLLDPAKAEAVKAFAQSVPLIDPFCDVIISSINDAFARQIRSAIESAVASILAKQASLHEAVAAAIRRINVRAGSMSNDTRQKAAQTVADWARLDEIKSKIQSTEIELNDRLAAENRWTLALLRNKVMKQNLARALREDISLILTAAANTLDPVQQKKWLADIAAVVDKPQSPSFSEVLNLARGIAPDVYARMQSKSAIWAPSPWSGTLSDPNLPGARAEVPIPRGVFPDTPHITIPRSPPIRVGRP